MDPWDLGVVWLVARSHCLVLIVDVAAIHAVPLAKVDLPHVLPELSFDAVDVPSSFSLETLTDVGIVQVPRRPAPALGVGSGRSRQGW